MKHIFSYGQGQCLSFNDFGNLHGHPILIQHGLIASITDEALFEPLIAAGARLIAIARPGYGDSSPYVLRNMAEWGAIVGGLVDHLKLARCDVLGMSSGAPYSYAIGYALPDRVRRLYIFSGIPALYDPPIAACWPHPLNQAASLPDLQKLAHDLFFANRSAEDVQRDDLRDSLRNEGFGLAQDFKLRGNDWGFTLADVQTPVVMEHSRDDESVPFAAAELTAQRLPRCRFDIREQGGHFSPELLADFLAMLVTEI